VCSPSPRSGANSEAAASARGTTYANVIARPFDFVAPAALTFALSTAAAISSAASAAATTEPCPKSSAAAVSVANHAAVGAATA
jgi:hypothetical protein